MISLSSHVLDTTKGMPASDMALTLTTPAGDDIHARTDSDGRVKTWGEVNFEAGIYRLRFATRDYLQAHHGNCFYPHVDIHFEMQADGGHYHIPLLISPHSFSSYRGS